MIENNLTGYINYFRQLAVMHKDIQHDVKSETGGGAVGSKKFTSYSIEEVVQGLRTTVGFPCLAIELYDIETEAESFSNITLRPAGAFMVLCHPENDSFAAQENCYTKAEQIVYDILKKMYNDLHGSDADACDTPFNEIEFHKIAITPVGPVFGGEYGYRVTYNFEFNKTIDLTEPPEEGTFIPIIE
jgi:hypothetical protein